MRFAEQCREQVNFQWEHVQVHFVLNQHAELDFIVLAHWNNNLRVDMSLNSDTLFGFRANLISGEATDTNDIAEKLLNWRDNHSLNLR
jgi:hypothetical protein